MSRLTCGASKLENILGQSLQPHTGRTKVGIALLPAKAGWGQEERPRRSPEVLGKG